MKIEGHLKSRWFSKQAVAMISISVKTLTGRKIALELAPDTTIGEIKSIIAMTLEIHIESQRLIYSSQQLHDGVTLEQYGVKDGDVFHIYIYISPGEL